MALVPERLNPFSKKEKLPTEIRKTFEVSPGLKETGIQEVEVDFPATAKDAQGPQGQPLIQTPQTQPLTIQVPAPSAETLKQIVKLSKEETSPWNAAFWLRAIKRAIFLGKQVIFGQPKANQPV